MSRMGEDKSAFKILTGLGIDGNHNINVRRIEIILPRIRIISVLMNAVMNFQVS